MTGFDSWQGQRIFHLVSVSRLTLGPTQSPIQLSNESSPRGKRQLGIMLTARLRLVPSSRMSSASTALQFAACFTNFVILFHPTYLSAAQLCFSRYGMIPTTKLLRLMPRSQGTRISSTDVEGVQGISESFLSITLENKVIFE